MLSMSSDTCEPRNVFLRLFEFDTQILKKEKAHFLFVTKFVLKPTPDQDHCLIHGT